MGIRSMARRPGRSGACRVGAAAARQGTPKPQQRQLGIYYNDNSDKPTSGRDSLRLTQKRAQKRFFRPPAGMLPRRRSGTGVIPDPAARAQPDKPPGGMLEMCM